MNPNVAIEGSDESVQFREWGDRSGELQRVQVVQADNSRSGTGYDFVLLPP